MQALFVDSLSAVVSCVRRRRREPVAIVSLAGTARACCRLRRHSWTSSPPASDSALSLRCRLGRDGALMSSPRLHLWTSACPQTASASFHCRCRPLGSAPRRPLGANGVACACRRRGSHCAATWQWQGRPRRRRKNLLSRGFSSEAAVASIFCVYSRQ